jgi:hypothetical protein
MFAVHSTVVVGCLCLQVTELQAKLQAAVQEAEAINNQEKMFGWAMTKYAALGAAALCFTVCINVIPHLQTTTQRKASTEHEATLPLQVWPCC